jgi:NADH-quinone oxidoreductase subunit L
LGFLIPALPLLAFILIISITRKRGRASALLSLCAIALSFFLSVWVLLDQFSIPAQRELNIPWLYLGSIRISLGVLMNPLTSLMLVIVTAVSLLVQIYSTRYMHGDNAYTRFFSYLSLFSFSMLTLVVANNFILFYMAWELVGLSSYLLIGFWYQKPAAAGAAKKAFIVTRFGDFGFLIGILVLSFLAGTFNFAEAESFVRAGNIAPGLLTLIVLLLFCGAIGKSGQFPLHVWLPDAMEGPTPVSALIHSATMVAAGVFMVARLFGIFQSSHDALLVVAYLGAFTSLFAALIALAQNDIKRVLAYSTLSQLGYMMLGLGVGGYTAGIYHLLTHAAFKSLLFLGAGSIIHALGTNDVWKMGGLGRKMPVTMVTFAIATLALAGIFPFSGFWSKDEILKTVLASGHEGLYITAIGTVFLTSFYMARVFFLAFSGAPRGETYAHESPPAMTVPLMILAVFSLGLGVLALPWLGKDIYTFLSLGGQERPGGFNLRVFLQSDILAIAGIAAAFLVYVLKIVKPETLRKKSGFLYTVLANKFYIDEFYMLLINGMFFTVTRAIAWFDRHAVDAAVNLVGYLVKRGGEVFRRTMTGKVGNYVFVIFCGAVLALAAFLLVNSGAFLSFGGGR